MTAMTGKGTEAAREPLAKINRRCSSKVAEDGVVDTE